MRKVAFIALVLLVLTSLLYSQTTKPTQLSKDYVEIFGVKLRLGMTKAEVAEKVSGAEILKPQENDWLVTAGQNTSTIHFENGKLTFASRTWYSKDNDIVNALFGAVTYFNNEGYAVCSVYADTVPDPQTSFQRVWIRCGNKSILISKTTHDGKTFKVVDEHLGVLKRNSQ